MQLKNHDKIIAESLDMLRKIQSLPQYADRSLHEMSIRYLLVEKLTEEDFSKVKENLETAGKNLELLENFLNQFKVYEMIPAGDNPAGELGSAKNFIDSVPKVQEYLEVMQNQVDLAMSKLKELDVGSKSFNRWISDFGVGSRFKKFRDYIPLLKAASELSLKAQTFAGGILQGMKAFQGQVSDSFKKLLKKAEKAQKETKKVQQSGQELESSSAEGSVGFTAESIIREQQEQPFLKISKESTIEQVLALAGRDTEKTKKMAASLIRDKMGAGTFKQMFNFLKGIKILPGLQKQLVGPVNAQDKQIDLMPDELADALMQIKLTNLFDPSAFKRKIEPQDAKGTAEAIKDAEKASEEMQDAAKDAKSEEETEASSEELVEPGEESAVESEVDDMARDAVSTAEDPDESEDAVEDTVLKAIENWENQLSDRQKKRLNAKGRLNKLKQAVQDVTPPEVDPPADPEEVAKAGRQWKEKYVDDPESPLSNPKNISHIQIKRLIDLFPQIVDKIQEDETEKNQQGEEQKDKKKNESINRKKMQLISESRQLQRWQLLAGLK